MRLPGVPGHQWREFWDCQRTLDFSHIGRNVRSFEDTMKCNLFLKHNNAPFMKTLFSIFGRYQPSSSSASSLKSVHNGIYAQHRSCIYYRSQHSLLIEEIYGAVISLFLLVVAGVGF